MWPREMVAGSTESKYQNVVPFHRSMQNTSCYVGLGYKLKLHHCRLCKISTFLVNGLYFASQLPEISLYTSSVVSPDLKELVHSW